ncbi:MAG TPA: 3-deoxy-7-phosphoheptulonate synthase, partial [Rhodanobacter sp.]|nr:3-deoxy-7-phosphoheptulonate synthase [Rhodanobacter sp.]
MFQPVTDDLRIREITPLATPLEVLAECPATPAALATVGATRTALHHIIDGSDDRLAVVIGPCSIHD